MCGIVGYVGMRSAQQVLLDGLEKLEYRGYDSAGVALTQRDGIRVVKSKGRLSTLRSKLEELALPQSSCGIGHTRWATHGEPSVVNAHPHYSRDQKIAVVHNGIIENFAQLRAELEATGVTMQSQTDTEVLAHLVNFYLEDDLLEALKKALSRVTGAYAVAVFDKLHPERIVGARQGSPMVVGLGEGENFIASDAMALVGVTDKIVYLDDGDIAVSYTHLTLPTT